MASVEQAALDRNGRFGLAGRLWRKVEFSDECWNWTGFRMKKAGHGQIGLGGRGAGVGLVHRLSYVLMRGEIPDDMCVCHTCDNGSCVRPEHLFLGTIADNNRDMDAKGRRGVGPNPGETNGNAIVSDEQAKAIREIYAEGELSQRELGAQYGLTQSAVSLIVLGKHYKNAGGPIAAKKHDGRFRK